MTEPVIGGCDILRQAVSQVLVDNVLRTIHLDLFGRGILPDEVKNYREQANWFPWLRDSEAVLLLESALPDYLRAGELCEPQLVLQLPDAELNQRLVFHTDKEPPWAGNRKYLRIVGVALTRSHKDDGGLLVQPLYEEDAIAQVELEPRDVVVLHPDLLHCSGMNRTGSIRYAVYYRYLEEQP